MGAHTLHVTDADFESIVVNSDIPVLVDFWAPWCSPCVAIGPVLDAIAEEYQGKIKVAKMNVDENSNIPAQLGVRSIPFIALYKGGSVVDNVIGAVPKTKLTAMIDKVL